MLKKQTIQYTLLLVLLLLHLFVSITQARSPLSTNENWMERLCTQDPSFNLLPVNQIIMPGSHDCGMNPTVVGVPGPDYWDVRSFPKFKIGSKALSFLSHWTITQKETTAAQLKLGSRYLDLRVAPMVNHSLCGGYQVQETNLYTLHTVYGESIENIFLSCKSFLKKNRKEVLILHFQHFYEMTEPSYRFLRALILHYFGEWLVPRTYPVSTPLKTLQEENKRVFILLGSDHQRYRDPLPPKPFFQDDVFWEESKTLSSHWANTTSKRLLQSFSDKEIQNHRKSPTLWVLQEVLTPDISTMVRYITKSFFDRDKATLATYERPLLHKQLPQWIAKWKSEHLPLNIIMTDFLDDAIAQKIIGANRIGYHT